jgi:hypothetical protein
LFLVSQARPLASYLQLADLLSDTSLDLTDRSGVALSTDTLNGWLTEHSGEIDALIGQSFLPQVETIRIYGQGSTFLRIPRTPIIYILQAKIVLPNSVGFDIPVQSLLVDAWSGMLQNMTPLTFQGVGLTTLFPDRAPIDVTVAFGIGWPCPPPTYTVFVAGSAASMQYGAYGGQLTPDTPLPAGTYAVQVTSVTINGESLPSVAQNITLASPGAIGVTIQNSPGALKYYVYQDGVWRAEVQGYAIGQGLIATSFNATPSTSPLAHNFDGSPRLMPTIDTSAIPFFGKYAALPRLIKLMIQSSVWEQKNPSNQGVYSMSAGPKRVMFKDNLKSSFAARRDALVDSLRFQGIA